jgi:hypothetical protein
LFCAARRRAAPFQNGQYVRRNATSHEEPVMAQLDITESNIAVERTGPCACGWANSPKRCARAT